MIESRTIGERYVAGLTMAFALVYLAAATFGPLTISPNFLSSIPAFLALLLGRRGWSAPTGASIRYSVAGLIVLLSGLALTRLHSVTS
jgi:hypothetical protein